MLFYSLTMFPSVTVLLSDFNSFMRLFKGMTKGGTLVSKEKLKCFDPFALIPIWFEPKVLAA